MTSLRRNLNISLSLILVVVFVVLWTLISVAIGKVARDQLLIHLEHDGDAVLSGLKYRSPEQLVVDENVIEMVYRQAHSGHYFLVRTGSGQVLKSPSLGASTLAVETVGPGLSASQRVPGPDQQSVLVLTRNVMFQGAPLEIVVGENLSEMNDEIKEQSITVLLIILPILALAVLLQSLIISRALIPLSHVEHALQQIGRGVVSRIDVESPTEIRPLVDEINRLLVLVNRRLIQSRTAIGNLAHALKTPLAMLFRVADDDTLPATLRATLQEHTKSIHSRLERELKRARLAGGDAVGGQIDLRGELDLMTRVLHGIYREKNLSIAITTPEGSVPFDREDVLELIGNLADNACKWATNKVAIEITYEAAANTLRIRVADDGPGCSEAQYELLKTRGLRLDESRNGHGLGLSICTEVVSFYGGELSFGRNPDLGGLEVVATLTRQLNPVAHT